MSYPHSQTAADAPRDEVDAVRARYAIRRALDDDLVREASTLPDDALPVLASLCARLATYAFPLDRLRDLLAELQREDAAARADSQHEADLAW